MLELFEDQCLNCGLQIDEGLTYRICSDQKCLTEIKNSTRLIDSSVYVYLAYNDPVYVFRRSIVDVEVYQNSVLLNETSDYTITQVNIGTVSGVMIKFDLLKTGDLFYEFRVRYYDPSLLATTTATAAKSTVKLQNSNRILQLLNATYEPQLPEYLSLEFKFSVSDPLMSTGGFFTWVSVLWILLGWCIIMFISFLVFYLIKYFKGEKFDEKSENGFDDMDIDELNEFFKSGLNQQDIFQSSSRKKKPQNLKSSNFKESGIELQASLLKNQDNYQSKYATPGKDKARQSRFENWKAEADPKPTSSQRSDRTMRLEPNYGDLITSNLKNNQQIIESEIVYSQDGTKRVRRKVRKLVKKVRKSE